MSVANRAIIMKNHDTRDKNLDTISITAKIVTRYQLKQKCEKQLPYHISHIESFRHKR